MGALEIGGSFSSSDWRKTIEKLQNEERRYHLDAKGNMVEDREYLAYGGTIASVEGWGFIEMNNSTKEKITAEIWRTEKDSDELVHFDKYEGIVAEGKLVGYDLYVPKIETLECVKFSYREYIDLKQGEYSVLSYERSRFGKKEIRVLKRGNLKECEEYARGLLYSNTDKVYVICGNRGKHYRCFNKVNRVKKRLEQIV